ncbi:protocadherin alpha-6-like [Physella acuta]|uniref:protocadherin alpha-6-like n=1 Tax=Physella acuta TaxID=109671 RepID=UPI0027DE56EE|nr:protocadherin alpha-6-like [Physella acuta]
MGKQLVFVLGFILALTSPVTSQNLEVEYSIPEERPQMYIGNLLTDLGRAVQTRNLQDLRFNFMTAGNPHAAYLWLNATNGDLKTASRIDRESVCRNMITCELRVQTTVQDDRGTFLIIVLVKVTITDINDNPPVFNPSTQTLKIAEDALPGYTQSIPTATDLDMGPGNSIVSYTQVVGSAPFTLVVNGNSASSFDLKLRLDEPLDRETVPFYKVLIQAIDGGTPRQTGTLTVNIDIDDVNDNAPVFEFGKYSFNVSESLGVNSAVGTVRATDKDVGLNGAVRYTVDSSQTDLEVFLMFSMNPESGEIRTLLPLDSYAGRTYRLTVIAQDSDISPKKDRTEVDISVLDTQNSEPKIVLNVIGGSGSGTAYVSEVVEVGRVVAILSVSDPDSNMTANGQVTCALNSHQFQLQAMDVNQYKVMLTRRLDRENVAYHNITVDCADAGTPSLHTSANFKVEVMDDNDNAPVFESAFYTAEVTEGSTDVERSLIQVHAIDLDAGVNAQLSYEVQGDSDFGVNSEGFIFVANPNGVDREDRVRGAKRELTVVAVDHGTPPLSGSTTVVLTIRDVNDNPPVFSQTAYSLEVPENSAYDLSIGRVSATDADRDTNAIFYFKMAPGFSSKVPFEIGLDGSVRVAGDLDRERTPSYSFKVIAYDLGEPVSLSSTVNVSVKIKDVNDNSPVFTFPKDDNITLSVPHTLGSNTAFAKVDASDADEGKNGALEFTAESGNGTRFFDIVSGSGQVVLIRPLSVNEIGLHVINIVAHDLGYPSEMSTQAVLHILVYEGNATVSAQDNGLGFRNIVVVAILVVVTVVLSLIIMLTIILIRRVDKQRRLYHAKVEETKVEANLKDMFQCPTEETEIPSGAPDLTGDIKDGGKKKKEVSFSLDEDNNINHPPTLTTFSPAPTDKYDLIPEKDRGNIKCDPLSSNHYQADRQAKAVSKKDISNFNFHQVHPTVGTTFKNRQNNMSAHNHDDNLSDVSADVSTSDSGRGGSDVELQSGTSKDSGDLSFTNQRCLSPHNNLNTPVGYGASAGCGLKNSSSAQFQNIHPDPKPGPTFQSHKAHLGAGGRAPLGSRPSHPAGSSYPHAAQQYNPNIFSDKSGSYLKLTNEANGRPNLPTNGSSRLMISANRSGEYMDMSGMRPYMAPRPGSDNSCMDSTNNWDADTTTSGSYTVDPQELCEEIDKLFFEQIKDVVV